MEANTPKRADFIPYPTNRVVGTVEDAHQARAAVDALLAAGFDREHIDVLRGDTGEQRLVPEGADYGFLAQFQRTLIRAAGQAEEYKHLMRHLEDVRAGRFVIMVLARQRDQRAVAADILNAHGADFVGFYGRWAWQALAPAATAEERESTYPPASHADEMPSRFVRAWNARDPDALASLFDEDAEFVNVTGLWWHNQHAIRNAHAYGLERIFSNSTLAIEETRVKQLGDNLAVVHARMTLSGQNPVGTIKRPGSRTNIISFVVHRTAGGEWRCASAHNTDVVPRMETNVIDDDGRLRSANYRSGHLSG
jgi:uncharacterized protein (TIGR02246 family)